MVSVNVVETDVALLALIVAVFSDDAGAVTPTVKRSVTGTVVPAVSVLLKVHVTKPPAPPACVQPAVVGAPGTSVKPAGTLSVSVVMLAFALPALAYSMV